MIVRLLVSALVCLLLAKPGFADFLILKSENKPIYGIVGAIDGSSVSISVPDAGTGIWTNQKFKRIEVSNIVRTIDVARLEELTISRLSEYRDYAEELSSFASDPIAKQIAIRLFLICIHHSDNTDQHLTLKISAAGNLPGLAGNDRERDQFELISFIYGNEQTIHTDELESIEPDVENKKATLDIIRALRREEFAAVTIFLNSRAGKRSVGYWSTRISEQAVSKAIRDKQVEAGFLEKLLSLELELVSDAATERTLDDRTVSFAQTFHHKPLGTKWIPSVTDLYEFDLEATLFRNGQWQRPQ